MLLSTLSDHFTHTVNIMHESTLLTVLLLHVTISKLLLRDGKDRAGLTDAVAMPIAFHLLPVAAYTGAATMTP